MIEYGERASITKEESKILRMQLEILWGGDANALMRLRYIFHTYRRWAEIFDWFIQNKLIGAKLNEFFQNEGDKDGRGLMPVVKKVIERIDQQKANMKRELKYLRKF